MIRSHFKIFAVVVLISLASCCWTSDSTVPPGYPFNGHAQELNFSLYGGGFTDPQQTRHGMYSSFFDTAYIDDTAECNSFFRITNAAYNCDIDFKKYSLAYVYGYFDQVYSYKAQTRVLVNHKSKSYTVELRGYTKTCNSGMNSNYNNHYIHNFLLVPKVPAGYSFKVSYFYPVQRPR